MNNQEIFNRVVAYARTMENPAITETDGHTHCMYRSDNGPCLIGSLIKDEFYQSKLESQKAYTYDVVEALQKSGFDVIIEDDRASEDFFDEMQMCHDFAANIEKNNCTAYDGSPYAKYVEELLPFNQQLMINLRVFADKYKLSMAE